MGAHGISRFTLLIALGVAALPGSAVAQQSGVSVDPGSPTGKEYALPLESARRQADPSRPRDQTTAPPGSSSDPSPLFGKGITPRGSGTRRPRSHRGANGRDKTNDSARVSTSAVPKNVRRAARQINAGTQLPGAGNSSSALAIGGGLAVLALGAAGGLIMRRRSG